jgi:isopenicillin-N synthase
MQRFRPNGSKTMTRLADVPTIDVSSLFGDDYAAKKRIAQQIDAACRGSGFFFAANHGVDLCALQETTSKLHKALTDEEKWELAINAYNPANPRVRNGYYMAIKGVKANESYCYLNPTFTDRHPIIISGIPMHEVNIWPNEGKHPGLREYYENYYKSVFYFSKILLRGFSIALDKDEYFFDQYFSLVDTLSSVSLIHYPYLDDYPPVRMGSDGTKLSFECHQDVSLITVLYQTPVPNLQVETSNGYQDIPTSGEYFLVNCGTYMAHITNNYYHAPVHRVKFINAERLSIPFFVNLAYHSIIKPFRMHRSERIADNASIQYGEYLENGLYKLIQTNGQT